MDAQRPSGYIVTVLDRSGSGMSLAPTIFHERWWLDAASSDEARDVTVEQGGRVVGFLPYHRLRRRFGLSSIGQPPLTYALGPAIAALPDGRPPAIQKRIAITRDLIRALPSALHVSFRLHGGVSDTLAFEAEGFACRLDYTVEIEPNTEAALWRAMRDKTRNVIRRAEECLQVREIDDADAFLDFYAENLRRRDRTNAYARPVALRVIGEARARRSGLILGATDRAGALQAAILTVWDHRSAYYLMSTRRPDSASGANSLLIWHALRQASANARVLDMAGLHVRRGELPNMLLLTGFGGTVTPRYFVERSTRLVAAARAFAR